MNEAPVKWSASEWVLEDWDSARLLAQSLLLPRSWDSVLLLLSGALKMVCSISVISGPGLLYSNQASDEELERTRSRFGSQKGISSDEFFGRDRFDPNAQAEAKERLRQFDGASAISSNAYFGRPEDDFATGDDTYGDLENAAKDFVRRFGITAGDDLENLTQLVGEGAVKLQGKYPYWSLGFQDLVL
jgi:hypothetical protein